MAEPKGRGEAAGLRGVRPGTPWLTRPRLGEEEEEGGEAWALGVGWGGGSRSVIARDVNADWRWQGVSGGRQASLVPGWTSWHISPCVKDSWP